VGVLTSSLLDGLAEPDFVHHVLCLPGGVPDDPPPPCSPARVTMLPVSEGVMSLERLREAVQAGRRFRPDVVRGATLEGNLVATAVGAACHVPVIYEQHGDGRDANWKARALMTVSAHAARRCLSVSPEVDAFVASALRVPRSRRVVVRNGARSPRRPSDDQRADLLASLGIPDTARVIGMVCRLHDHIKRVSDAIKAMAILGPECPDARLLIVGDGPDRRLLEGLADDLVPGSVVFAGGISPADSYYFLMDVFVVSSATEGAPLTVAEAMHAGLPVVATTVGGLPSMVSHEQTGVLVPSFDPRSLATALRRLLVSADLRETFGHRGRVKAQMEFSLERHCSDYRTLLDGVRRS
jgi:L-malate glycosyltransferase